MVVFWPLLSQPSGRREAGGGEEGEGEEGTGPAGHPVPSSRCLLEEMLPHACWGACFQAS